MPSLMLPGQKKRRQVQTQRQLMSNVQVKTSCYFLGHDEKASLSFKKGLGKGTQRSPKGLRLKGG